MNYVFTFIGEFGYELLNWQSVIRKWVSTNKKEGDTIIICSRKGLDLLYDFADYYIDISNLKSLQTTVGDCYTSYVFLENTGPHLPRREWKITREGQHITDIKISVQQLVVDKLNFTTDHRVKWIWSCDYIQMDGSHFGLGNAYGGIYNVSNNRLRLSNNTYDKLSEVKSLRGQVENKLGFSLDEDYILCQTGFRQGYALSKLRLDHDKAIKKLEKECKVVLMDFNTKKLNDSFSSFKSNSIEVEDIKEQSVLICNAKRCVFFTEGHLRSHTYLPPMFGRDVEIVAAREMFSFSEAPLDFWNEHVFKFGGKMIAKPYEDFIND